MISPVRPLPIQLTTNRYNGSLADTLPETLLEQHQGHPFTFQLEDVYPLYPLMFTHLAGFVLKREKHRYNWGVFKTKKLLPHAIRYACYSRLYGLARINQVLCG